MAVIREKRQFKIGPVGVARASEGGQIVGKAISDSANQLAGEFFKQAAFQAEKTGEEAASSIAREQITAIDPNTGKPQAFAPPQGFGQIATEAYQRVIMRRFQQSYDDEMQNKARELAAKYEGNPNGVALYESAMSDYMAAMSNEAEGQFKTYIQDVGTTYLNATKTSLAISQIQRERTAAAQAQAQAVENGYEAFESMVAQGGPRVLQGPTQTNAVIAQVQNTIKDGVDSGLFDSQASLNMGEAGQLAQARGLLRYAITQTTNPDKLKLLQHAVGTQNAGAVPQEFSYIADAMKSIGSNYSALSQLEQFSDGLLSDSIQAAQVVQDQELRSLEAENAISIFDMQQSMPAALSKATSQGRNSFVPTNTVAVQAISSYTKLTNESRNALVSGNKTLSEQLIKNRDDLLSAHVEGLMLRAVKGLTKKQTEQLEKAIFSRTTLGAPDTSKPSLEALIKINNEVNPKVLDEFLPFIGSYRDAAGKYVEAEKKANAALSASTFDESIDNLDKLRGSDLLSGVQSLTDTFSLIDDLDESLRQEYIKEIQLRGAQASINEFFEANPSKETAIDAKAYLDGAAPTSNLNDRHLELLKQASNYAKTSKTESTVREHFNRGASVNSSRIDQAKKNRQYYENEQRLRQRQLDPTSITDQKFVDDFLTKNFADVLQGEPLSTFWSNAEAQQTERGQVLLNAIAGLNTMPYSLQESLSSFASGNFLGGSPVALLSQYTGYREYEYMGTTMRSPMMQGLDESQVAVLDYLADASRLIGSDPQFLSRAFAAKSELERNPRYKENVEAFLGTNLDDYVSQISGIQDAPLSAYNGMKAATLDLMGVSHATGLNIKELTKRLERQLNASYPSGEGIVLGPNGSARTAAPISYAAPKNEDLFKDYIINQVTKAQPNAEPPELGLKGDSREGAIMSAIRLTAQVIATGTAPKGNIFLKPIGVPTRGQVQYAVFRITSPEEGGYEQVYTEIVEEGQSIRAPLILSNKDKPFLDMVSKRTNRESKDAIASGTTKYAIPRGIPTDALGGAVITGGGTMFGVDPTAGLQGPMMELN
jgi:hypothetical protein